jgi:hypothetical protein
MIDRIVSFLRHYSQRQRVRPWALATPIAVLLICLPLLRPLRHPDPYMVSDSEMARLATIESLVERRTLAISDSPLARTADVIQVGDDIYSNQMPVMSLLLSGSFWVLHRLGWTMEENFVLVPYLLTMLGVTLPVAAGAGLIYRMGRMFELRRPWRAGLAMAVALGSGLISYAVVLNSYAPAGALVLASAACLIQVVVGRHPAQSGGWLAIAGLCASLAAVIDLAAGIFAVLMVGVILAMRWPVSLRIGGALLYLIGCTPPVVLHAVLTVPITGDLRPGYLHPQLALNSSVTAMPLTTMEPEDGPPAPSRFAIVFDTLKSAMAALLGPRGLLSHFPIVILGLFGVAAVMHRHWPAAAKVLASATLAGTLIILLVHITGARVPEPGMFAIPWFVVFAPLMMFWIGAWLRKSHHPATWAVVGVMLAFSIAVSLLGATGPHFPADQDEYTALSAAKRLVQDQGDISPGLLAGG